MSWSTNGIKIRSDRNAVIVKEGIPRFVPEKNYASTFGDQWHYFPKTQLDSYTKVPISENRLRRCLGEDLWMNLENKKILEVGCGAGRFTEILLKKKAKVFSIDLSNAVEVNANNFPVDENHYIFQADILNLPFEMQQFDIVICLGVLQHTPDPSQTIRCLVDQLKINGYLVIDQYIFNRSYWSMRLIYRQIFKRLPSNLSFRVLKILSFLFLPMHQICKNSRILSLILNRFSPFVTYYRDIPLLNDQLQKEWALLDTFDSLTDWYKNFGTQESLRKHLESSGLTVQRCELGGNGIEARAIKFEMIQ